MSRSIHITFKDLKGLTKAEITEQFNDAHSDLAELAKKRAIKKETKLKRKEKGLCL